VLLVVADNDPEALELLVTDFKLEGHNVAGTAFGGDRALELCRELRPDALVVDFRMPPGMNGVQTAQCVHDELPEIRVIIYTNYVNPTVARGARKAGAVLIEKGNLRALRRALVDALPPT